MILATREIAIRVASSMSYGVDGEHMSTYTRSLSYNTHVVLVRIHRLCIESFFTFAITGLHVLANPYVSVETQNQVDAARQSNKMTLQAPN